MGSRYRRERELRSVPIRLKEEIIEAIDQMVIDGKWKSRGHMLTSMITAIIEDDEKEEAKP